MVQRVETLHVCHNESVSLLEVRSLLRGINRDVHAYHALSRLGGDG